MPAITFSKDMKTGKYLACNMRFAEYADLKTTEEVVGLTDYDMFDEKTSRHFEETDRKAIEMDVPYEFYEEVYDAKGKRRDLRTTKLKFTDASGRACVLGMCVDVTELARRKARLDWSIAVPQVFQSRIQYLLPIHLTRMDKPDLAMALSVMDGYYVGHTCLTLEMAYQNARLLARPTAGWLTELVSPDTGR